MTEPEFSKRDGVDLKVHLELQIKEMRRYYDERLKSIDDSTNKTAKQLEKRLEGMNEFRAAMKDQQAITVTRNEFNLVVDKINEELQLQRDWKSSSEGKASQNSVIVAILMASAALIIGLAKIYFRA